MKYLRSYNTYNESIRNYLKYKKTKDILNSVKTLTPEELLIKSIRHNFLYGVKLALRKKANISIIDRNLIQFICEMNNIDIIKELLKNKNFDPSVNNNFLICYSSLRNNIDMVKLLLKDKRVDPSDMNNYAIRVSFKNNNLNLIKELLKDERVRNSLSNDDLYKYEKSINILNESIRHLLKPKSENEIIKSIENLSPQEKLYKGCVYGILWLVEDAIKKGADPSMEEQEPINIACEHGNFEVVKYLLEDERVHPSIWRNNPLLSAMLYDYKDIVDLLLSDKRVDPSDYDNRVIRNLYREKIYDGVKFLLKDERVRNSLSEKDLNQYESVNSLTESIRHLLKPKSEDDIISRLSDMYPYEKLSNIIRYDLSKYFKFEEIIDIFEKCNIDKKRIIVSNFLSKYHYTKKWNDKILRFSHVFDMTDLDLLNFFKEVIIFDIKKINKNKINESIRHLLKPKSEDEIKKSFKNMSIEDKNKIMIDFIRQEDLNMVLFMLNNGLEITGHMINAATTCHNLSIFHLLIDIREKRIKNKEKTINENIKNLSQTKIVDELGNPLVVYRTQKNDRKQTIDRSSNMKGIYFSSDEESTKIYGHITKKYYLNIENPIILKDTEWNLSLIPIWVYNDLIKKGYDGAIWLRNGVMYEIIAFYDHQVIPI